MSEVIVEQRMAMRSNEWQRHRKEHRNMQTSSNQGRGGTDLDVPVALAQRVQAQLVRQLCRVHRVGQILASVRVSVCEGKWSV